jgi:hypothetical protein
MVYPEISYADVITLASMTDIREAGVSVRFEMTRASALRAFNRGFSAAAITELLKRLSANRTDENLIWTINEWEKRYGEVTLSRGLVLSLSPERQYLAETKPLARLIKKTLAPGVYLLAHTAEAEAAEALHTAGVDIVARYGEDESGPGAGGHDGSPGGTRKLFAPLCSGDLHKNQRATIRVPGASRRPAAGAKSGARRSRLSASTLIKGFHSILERMRFSKTERDELAARIDRRLVLCEAQLRDASVRYRKLEARGLDFTGKTVIAKQAIVLQSPMELVLPGKNGKRIFGMPMALEKENDESVLVISSLGEGDILRIPLGKISHLRRIKKSLFENSI